MIEIKVSIEKLVELINKYKVKVSFNGIQPFEHEVVNARKLLDELHEIADCDKATFIEFVNSCNSNEKKYIPNEMIKCLFENIKYQGQFMLAGHEALGRDPYIEISKISKVIPCK